MDHFGFRLKLFVEESNEAIEAHGEYATAVSHPSISELTLNRATAHLLQELADTVIVAYGTASRLGFDLEDVIFAVMRAAMRKTRNPDPAGKALKPAGWIPPLDVLEEMVVNAERKRLAATDPFVHDVSAHRSVRPFVGNGFGPVVSAQFESLCNECDDEIEIGDPIRVGPEGSVHDECAREVLGELDRA
jgi:hypothetical protein